MKPHHALLFVSLLSILGCARETTSAYLPSEDPLVLARFENFLDSESIEYQRDSDGMYFTLDQSTMDRMIELGHLALDIEPGREGLKIERECASSKLQRYLDDADVFFAMRQETDGTYLVTTPTDFSTHKILNRYASYEFDCRESLNK